MKGQTDLLLVFLISSLRAFTALFWGIFLLFHRKRSQQILSLSSIFIIIGLFYLWNSFFRLPAIGPVDTYAPLSYFVLILIAPLTIFYLWFTLNEKRKLTDFLIHYIPFLFVVLFYLVVRLSGEAHIPSCDSIVETVKYYRQYPWQVLFYITLMSVFVIQVFVYFNVALVKILAVFKTYKTQKLSFHSLKLLLVEDCIFLIYPIVGMIFLSFKNILCVEISHNLLVSFVIATIGIINIKLVLPIKTNIDFISVDELKIKPNYSLNVFSNHNEVLNASIPCLQPKTEDANQNESDEFEESDELCSRIKALMEDKEIFRLPHLTLDVLVSELNSNRSYVSAAINSHYGCNFRQLLIRYRIDAAKELLLKSELDIQDISEQAGFNSRMSFYRAFKENVCENLSPMDWRKQDQLV